MKCLQFLGLAVAVASTLLVQAPGFAKGGHGHSGGHSHSGGSHHGTAHHSAPHHAAPHHSTPHAVPHHAAPQTAGPVHRSQPHSVRPQASPPSFAHNGSHHHGWGSRYWHHGYNSYWGNGYWSAPWGVWEYGTAGPNVYSPWYYESFFSVEPEIAVLPENGPTVSRGRMSRLTQPVSPPVGLASNVPAEVGPTESDGN